MRPDYCPMVNEPCQSMCDTPCSVNRLATQRIPQAVTQIPQEHSSKQEQRKPLTDKQLNIIGSRWHLNLLGADEKAELFAFARAIEAAHGIKGEA